jgi:hypothetical protein
MAVMVTPSAASGLSSHGSYGAGARDERLGVRRVRRDTGNLEHGDISVGRRIRQIGLISLRRPAQFGAVGKDLKLDAADMVRGLI